MTDQTAKTGGYEPTQAYLDAKTAHQAAIHRAQTAMVRWEAVNRAYAHVIHGDPDEFMDWEDQEAAMSDDLNLALQAEAEAKERRIALSPPRHTGMRQSPSAAAAAPWDAWLTAAWLA